MITAREVIIDKFVCPFDNLCFANTVCVFVTNE